MTTRMRSHFYLHTRLLSMVDYIQAWSELSPSPMNAKNLRAKIKIEIKYKNPLSRAVLPLQSSGILTSDQDCLAYSTVLNSLALRSCEAGQPGNKSANTY